jgi:hypothetical protein
MTGYPSPSLRHRRKRRTRQHPSSPRWPFKDKALSQRPIYLRAPALPTPARNTTPAPLQPDNGDSLTCDAASLPTNLVEQRHIFIRNKFFPAPSIACWHLAIAIHKELQPLATPGKLHHDGPTATIGDYNYKIEMHQRLTSAVL